MTGAGKWAITVTELEPGEFHFTVLEAVADDGDNFVFRTAILSDDAHKSAMGAWVAGLRELTNFGWDAITLLLSERKQRAGSDATTIRRGLSDAQTLLLVADRVIGVELPKR
jgi:hypothetical protein